MQHCVSGLQGVLTRLHKADGYKYPHLPPLISLHQSPRLLAFEQLTSLLRNCSLDPSPTLASHHAFAFALALALALATALVRLILTATLDQ